MEAQIKLDELLTGHRPAELVGSGDVDIETIEYDSRRVTPHGMFVAVKGYRHDGFEYVPQAVEQGAVAVVGERRKCDLVENYIRVKDTRLALADLSAKLYDYPGRKLKIYGVTGTNGKTTVCFLIKSILGTRDKQVGLITSIVYDTGGESYAAERTTPESLDLQRLLSAMKNNHCANAVVEVSSHALVLHRVDNIDFRVAVFTNITRDHLDFHQTMENYLEAKKLLLRKLKTPSARVVVNIDVPEFRAFIGELACSYVTYSLEDPSADVSAASYRFETGRTLFELKTPMGVYPVDFPLPGRFNLINALAAAGAGLAAGIDIERIVHGLQTARPVPGRLNPVECGQPFGVYVDYAHTPDALERLCETARELSPGRLLVLFGCGGDRDRGKRPLMGQAATRGADYCVVTSDNPRSEEPDDIIKEIKRGLEGDRYDIIPDRREAIEKILKTATAGDVVLLAGKGAENYQEIKGVKHDFDDQKEARRVLAELGYTGLASDKGN